MPNIDNNRPPGYDRLYKVLRCLLDRRFMRSVLKKLGYSNRSEELVSVRELTCQKYSRLLSSSVVLFTSECIIALLSVFMLVNFAFWGYTDSFVLLWAWIIAGIMQHLIVIFKARVDYQISIKMGKSSFEENSRIGSAMHRKRPNPYIFALVCTGLIAFGLYIGLLIVGVIKTGLPTDVRDLLILPLTVSFFIYYMLTFLLKTIDIMCSFCGYKSAIFCLDIRVQLNEIYE